MTASVEFEAVDFSCWESGSIGTKESNICIINF
jgi:hypothetical protein